MPKRIVRRRKLPRGVKEVYIGYPITSVPGAAGSLVYRQLPMSRIEKR